MRCTCIVVLVLLWSWHLTSSTAGSGSMRVPSTPTVPSTSGIGACPACAQRVTGRAAKLLIFQAWLEGCGGWVSHDVEMKVHNAVSEDVGLFAVRDIPENTAIATVPWECVITPTEMEARLRASRIGAGFLQAPSLRRLLPPFFLLLANRDLTSTWRHCMHAHCRRHDCCVWCLP